MNQMQSFIPQGESAQHVYTLRQGYLKLLHLNPDGTSRIVRLVKPGDLFGMEALLGDYYKHAATALTNIRACKIPKNVISSLGEGSPRLHRQIVKKWGGRRSRNLRHGSLRSILGELKFA